MKEKNYKQSIEEIEEIVQRVETQDLDVDELSSLVKNAAQLIQNCKKMLRQTEEDLNNTIQGMEE